MRKHKWTSGDCLCDAEWEYDGKAYEHCDPDAVHEGENWCMVTRKDGQSRTCRKILRETDANWGYCDPYQDWSTTTVSKRKRSSASSSSSAGSSSSKRRRSQRKTPYRASRCKCAQQTDGTSCGLYTILNAIHFAHSNSFLPTYVHPERDTYTFGDVNISLATFLRHFYARTVVGEVQPGRHPLIVDVERVYRNNRIKTYKLVVGFVSKRELETDRRMVHHTKMDDYKRTIDRFDKEKKSRFPINAKDIEERLYTENGMVNDNIIEIVLKVFIDRIPSFLTVSPLVAQERSLTKVIEKQGAGKKHVLVPINDACHWYLLHYNVEKDAFNTANSINGTQNIEKEKVVAAHLRAFYQGRKARQGHDGAGKTSQIHDKDIVVLEEERFPNGLKRIILLEEKRRGVRLVGARRAYNDRLRALVSDASENLGL